MSEHVYFVSAGDYIKVGITSNLKTRLSGISVGSALPIKVEYLLENAANAREIEKKAHQHFKHLKSNGEWFKRAALIDFVANFLLEVNHIKDIEPEDVDNAVRIFQDRRLIKDGDELEAALTATWKHFNGGLEWFQLQLWRNVDWVRRNVINQGGSWPIRLYNRYVSVFDDGSWTTYW